MFRILVEPKNPKGDADYIPVFDKIYEDFNDFVIDMESKEIIVALNVNPKQSYAIDFFKMQELLKESWDHYGLQYEFAPYPSSYVKVRIPDGYKVQVVLK